MNHLFIQNLKLYAFFIFKIPLIIFCLPRLTRLSKSTCHLIIPLTLFTKNHVKSMYFACLMMGVDLACGLLAMHLISLSKHNISVIFKDTSATFLKRAEHAVRFECTQGKTIQNLINKTISSKERVNKTIPVIGFCNKTGNIVAEFTITLSLKCKH